MVQKKLLTISSSNKRSVLSVEDTKNMQTYLKSAGLYKGSLTGKKSSELDDAIKLFQNNMGLDADGILGPKTLQYLSRMKDLLSFIYTENSSGTTTMENQ